MKKFLAGILFFLMIFCAQTICFADSAASIELKRDLETNGIYLRATRANNGQTMILAQYREDELKWVSVVPVSNGEGSSSSTRICTDYELGDTFKGFLWDSISDATPALDSISAVAKDIEAPVLWLDAADESTITLVDGKVSNWADKSGNGRDVYQDTDASRPSYTQGEYVQTNGSTFMENRSPYINKNSFTLFLMADIDSMTGQHYYISEASSTSGNPSYAIYTSNKNGDGYSFNRGGSSSNKTTVQLAPGYWGTGKQLHVYTDNKEKIGSIAYREDKTVIVTPKTYKNCISQTTALDIFSIGARRYYDKALKINYGAPCKYREILIYEGVLDEADRIEIQNYLLKKWGLEPGLPDADGSLVPDTMVAVSIDPESETDTQNAYYYVPADALDETKDPVPLVVGLHSWSARYDNASASSYASMAKARGWAMIHPDFRGQNDNPDAGASELAVDDVVRAVEFMKEHANIDENRIYLVGESGGGHMALSVASRRPDIWAGVSAWVPITDLVEWYNFGNSYAGMVKKCCGGVPGQSEEVDYQYWLRSPINHLQNATHIPLDINAGIHDGHTGSVPISHSLWAFNKLAQANGDTDYLITDEEIRIMTEEERVPEGTVTEEVDLNAEARKCAVHFRRTTGNARVTIFEGGHAMEIDAAFRFLEDKVKTTEETE